MRRRSAGARRAPRRSARRILRRPVRKPFPGSARRDEGTPERSVRPWPGRQARRAAVQRAAALVAVGLCVTGMSVLVWQQLAERTVMVAETLRSPTPRDRDLEIDLRAGAPTPRREAGPIRSVVRSRPEASTQQRTASPSGVSGRKLALALIAAFVALGLAAQRRILRRRPSPPHLQPRRTGGEPEDVGGSPVDTDPEGLDTPLTTVVEPIGAGGPEDARLGATGPPADADATPRTAPGLTADVAPDVARQQPAGPAPGTILAPATPANYRFTLYDRSTATPIPYRTPARLQWQGNDVACSTVRLSLEQVGCEFSSAHSEPPPSGTPVRITIRLGGALAPLTGRVRWSRLDGDVVEVGLRLDQLPPEHRALLARTLQEHSPAG